MSLNNTIFIENLPKLDIHGLDQKAAEYYINQFINERVELNELMVVIIHGIGQKILLKKTHETLKNNKKVIEFKTWNYNEGITIVYLKN